VVSGGLACVLLAGLVAAGLPSLRRSEREPGSSRREPGGATRLGGNAQESNLPRTAELPRSDFEDRGWHQPTTRFQGRA
jgi:hypothetical protein